MAPPGLRHHDGRQFDVIASWSGSSRTEISRFVMHWVNRLRNRFRAFTNIQAVDRDLDDEVTAHLEAAAAEYQRTGLSREAALLAARRDFGAVTKVMEDCREVQRMPWLASIGRDGTFAWRLLKRSPGFAFAAVVTLALGLGANTAIYSVIRGVLLRRVPCQEPDRP